MIWNTLNISCCMYGFSMFIPDPVREKIHKDKLLQYHHVYPNIAYLLVPLRYLHNNHNGNSYNKAVNERGRCTISQVEQL